MKKSTFNDYPSIPNLDIMKRIQSTKKVKRPPSSNSLRTNKSQEDILSKSSLKTQNSTLFKNELKTTRDSNIFSYINDPEIDSEINELFKQYYESKSSRKQSEETFNHFNNKLNKLQKDEEKAKEKEKLLKKNYERMEKIQFKNLKEKELVMRNKEKMEKKLKEHKKNNDLFRNKRDMTLKNFRNNVAKNNFDIISKIKEKRKDNYNKYLVYEENQLRNKQEHVNFVNRQRTLSQENKKQNEYEKKLRLKNELLKKIKEEEQRKRNFELESNRCQNESMEVITRIKNIDEEIEKEKIMNI